MFVQFEQQDLFRQSESRNFVRMALLVEEGMAVILMLDPMKLVVTVVRAPAFAGGCTSGSRRQSLVRKSGRNFSYAGISSPGYGLLLPRLLSGTITWDLGASTCVPGQLSLICNEGCAGLVGLPVAQTWGGSGSL